MSDAVLETFNRLKQKNRDGFLISQNGKEYNPSRGFAVGCRRCENVHEAIPHMTDRVCLGWWRGPDGVEHIDLVRVFEKRGTAMLAAYASGELAIYDFERDELIDCSHWYDPPSASRTVGNQGIETQCEKPH